MRLHPMLQDIIDQSADLPAMETLSPEQIRRGTEARYTSIPRPEVASVEDRMIPGPRGDIRIRIYRPNLADNRPVIMFFHGSGFVICSLDTHDGLCRQLCKRSDMIVVSVDYALAPENKFPAGPDDSLAATLWVAENAATFGGDAARLIVAGDSAGGTMAIVTVARIRDAGGPAISAQFLMYPVTCYPDPAPKSYSERGSGCGLTEGGMRWFWHQYLPRASDGHNPHASPLLLASLEDMPPAYIITAEFDLLRDEGEAFSDRLKHAGVDTTLIRYADMNHGFMSLVGVLDRADEALDAACGWLAERV